MRLRYDLHLHSCLSPCGDGDMTPFNLVNMAALAGYDVVALTDHNTAGNCRAAMAAAAAAGILLLPGMELTTVEEVHVVCLFGDIDAAEAFGSAVYRRLPDMPNNPEIFGRQLFMDAADGILGEEPRMLLGATDIGIYEVRALVSGYGGFSFPAHIDRKSFSVMANLGFLDEAMGFSLAELSRRADPTVFVREHPELAGLRFIINSDAHRLEDMPDPAYTLEAVVRSPGAVLASLRSDGGFSTF